MTVETLTDEQAQWFRELRPSSHCLIFRSAEAPTAPRAIREEAARRRRDRLANDHG
jgi:hypothetical protein